MIAFIQIILTIMTEKQGKMVAKNFNSAETNFVHQSSIRV
jgi:hypothetical protein